MTKQLRNPNGTFKPGTHWRRRKPFWTKEWLEREYIENERSAQDIAESFGVGATAIFYWLHKHGIPTRDTSEARSIKHWGADGESNPMYGIRGSRHPGWKGGVTPERQREYRCPKVRAFLRSIRVRDGVCQRCGNRAKLDVHHIRPYAECPELRYDPANCTSLCRPCHAWVHSSLNEGREFLER